MAENTGENIEDPADQQQLQQKDQRPGVYIKTYGCQMNEYDSQKLFKVLEPDFRAVSSAEQASLVIINTCSIRERPEQKVYSMLGELSEQKKQQPGLIVGVGGCVAQQEGQQIVKRNKAVDFVFGTHNLSVVPALIEARRNGMAPQIAVDYRDEWEDLPIGFAGDPKICAFVSVSRGCNKNCSYCVVPNTRGKEVSRPVDEILRELRLLAHRGTREVILLGQTVNSYGLDLNPRTSFVKLLEEVSEIKGIERIRFMSPHPQEMKQDFVDFLADCPKICRHIHMPLQSGSNRILSLMNRNYKREKYLNVIDSLKARAADLAISTDLIIGFPSENEKDFGESLDILEKVRFDSSYSYLFSARPGTDAVKMMQSGSLTDNVSKEEKNDRLLRWQARQNEITQEVLKTWQGKICEILIDGYSSLNPQYLKGRTSQNIVVNLNQALPQLKPGMFARVRITGISRYTAKAEVLAISLDPVSDQQTGQSKEELLIADLRAEIEAKPSVSAELLLG